MWLVFKDLCCSLLALQNFASLLPIQMSVITFHFHFNNFVFLALLLNSFFHTVPREWNKLKKGKNVKMVFLIAFGLIFPFSIFNTRHFYVYFYCVFLQVTTAVFLSRNFTTFQGLFILRTRVPIKRAFVIGCLFFRIRCLTLFMTCTFHFLGLVLGRKFLQKLFSLLIQPAVWWAKLCLEECYVTWVKGRK